jgi:hypothetical protein
MTNQRLRVVAFLQLLLTIVSVLVPKHVCTCQGPEGPGQHVTFCNGALPDEHCSCQHIPMVVQQVAATTSEEIQSHTKQQPAHCPYCEFNSARLTAILATSFVDQQVRYWHFVANVNHRLALSCCTPNSSAIEQHRNMASSAISGPLHLRI